MESDLAFKLVIAIPSFLFLISFFLKGILEGHNLNKIYLLINSDSNLESKIKGDLVNIFRDFYKDFYYLISIESLFVLVVNGLIFIFQFEKTEIGVVLIIISLVIFLIVSLGTKIGDPYLIPIGMLSTMTILGFELGYFVFNDVENILGVSSFLLKVFTVVICLIICVIGMGTFKSTAMNKFYYEHILGEK